MVSEKPHNEDIFARAERLKDSPLIEAPIHIEDSAKPQPANEKTPDWWTKTQLAFQSPMPQWALDNSTRVNQLGLMAGTTIIMGSVWKGKAIGKDIWKAQEKILESKGFHGNALTAKISKLTDAGIMKKPALHRERMIYLPTAIGGLAVGGFIKDKETEQDREAHKGMPIGDYLGMRMKQSLDPLHHSRQTAGVIGAASGAFAIWSAFSQPGGALISEAFVGGTLIAGFSGLTLIDDPSKAKSWLNVCWATRLPFVLSGTYETLSTYPAFANPMAMEMKKTSEYADGVVKAMREGAKVPRFGLAGLAGHETVHGGKAADAFSKSFVAEKLPYRRRDWSYPIGQWSNMALATFGFLTAGTDEKKQQAEQPTQATPILASPSTTIQHGAQHHSLLSAQALLPQKS